MMIKDFTDDEKDAFLEEYRILCLKHKLQLRGCGCCGSPLVSVVENNATKLFHRNYEEICIDEEKA